ncbi:hypothetical protein [Catenulispora rubra]|uniref:hypothetical protein n=1 Tax=Catenulispora rubra TaxID=280293 RepID=UPI001892411E|nr:hypothetical protein [Catenulispora rubra]
MANYLYITRATEWGGGEDFPIGSAEWLAFAEADPRLEPDEGGGSLDWVFTCTDGTKAWLSWKLHVIEVRGTHAKDADLAVLARDLTARLVDTDYDEEYHPNGTTTPWSESRRPILPG